jgi:DNA polymerase-3 subunit beta
MEVLQNVLLKDGLAMATDMDMTVVVQLPEAEGQCVLPFRTVADVLKLIPWKDTLTLEQRGKDVDLRWNGGKASYQVPEAGDFPPPLAVEATVEQPVDGDILVPALLTMSEYCATETTRPMLNGVTLMPGEHVEVWGADGFKLAHMELPIAFPADGRDTLIIPATAVKVLGFLWKKAAVSRPMADSLVGMLTTRRVLELGVGANALKAQIGKVTFTTKLIQGSPPNFRQLMPDDSSTKLQVFGPDLERAVRQVQGVARDGSGVVRLSWSEISLTVSAKGEDTGNVEASIPVEATKPGRVALNVSYLLGYLRGKEGVVTMGTQEETSRAVLFEHSSLHQVLIMPMNVQW